MKIINDNKHNRYKPMGVVQLYILSSLKKGHLYRLLIRTTLTIHVFKWSFNTTVEYALSPETTLCKFPYFIQILTVFFPVLNYISICRFITVKIFEYTAMKYYLLVTIWTSSLILLQGYFFFLILKF